MGCRGKGFGKGMSKYYVEAIVRWEGLYTDSIELAAQAAKNFLSQALNKSETQSRINIEITKLEKTL